MNFYIDDSCYRKSSPTFENIKVKGYFSLSDEKSIKFDSSQLRYYKNRTYENVYFDLDEGRENARPYTNKFINHHLDKILHWIKKENEKILAMNNTKGEKWLEPNFISRRGTISKLLKTPYLKHEDLILCAAKWKGTIYLCEFFSNESNIRHDNMQYQLPHQPSTCWGHKFEQYILSDTADGLPDTTKPVDHNLQFCCIFQSRLGEHSLLYAAEIDGVCSDETLTDPLPLDELKFIELKTNRIVRTPVDRHKFAKFKSLNIWSQSLPIGIDKILCGFKDEQGIVREMAEFRPIELINMSRYYWTPAVSLNFLNDFLTHVESVVVNDCDKTIYKFEKVASKDVIEMTQITPPSEYSFLPDWYTQNLI